MSQKLLREGKDRSTETRLKLIEAAAEAFSELGFRDATVREICRRAGANVAAVNYHFGDKDRLYSAALDHCIRVAHEKYPPNLGVTATDPPDKRLAAFVRSLLLRLFDSSRASRHGQLIARELVDPTPALDEQVKSTIGPMMAQLDVALREMVGDSLTDEQRHALALQVLSQCTAYHHYRPLIDRLYPDQGIDAAAIGRLAEQITQFTLSGIRGLVEARGAPTNGVRAR
jgi:TetR/AcrR family transcriptional regulator, regulator of cefoperazone and chloramphenicol sensitivity